MKKVMTIIAILIVMVFIDSFVFARDIPYTQEDRDRLIRVEAKLESLEKGIDKRFEGIDKRFEGIDKRFDDLNSQLNRLAAIFTAIVVFTLGFAIWDRRTMVRPFETKIKKIEEDIAENRNKLHVLIESLRSLSKKDPDVAEILKKFNLL